MKVLNKNLAYLLIGTSSLLGVAHIAMAQQLELDPNPAPILVEGAGWVRSVAQGVSADGSEIFGYVADTTGGATTASVWDSKTGKLTVLQNLALDAGRPFSANGASADGKVIFGGTVDAQGVQRPLVWLNETSTPTGLDALDANSTAVAHAISADGTTIVGSSNSNGALNNGHAVLWSRVNGAYSILDLGTLGGATSAAAAVSHDGSVIVGSADLDATHNHAAAWYDIDSHAVDLGTLGGNSSARGLSADGTVIVGQSNLAGGDLRAVAWYGKNANPVNLGVLNGGSSSFARTVSADGSVIIGGATYSSTADTHAVAWYNQETTPTDLGTLGGKASDATAVSANGGLSLAMRRMRAMQSTPWFGLAVRHRRQTLGLWGARLPIRAASLLMGL